MADEAPLLPRYHSSENQNELDGKRPSMASVDETLESYLGGCQLLQAIFVSFAWAFDAQQTFINVFTDADPAWHCASAGDSAAACSASTPCGLPPGSWVWDSPAHASVVSEWSLQCAGSALVGLPASAYFAGCLLGGLLLSTLADSVLGRKNMLFFSCFTMSLSAALTVVSPNLWAYAAMRFLCGCARATIGTSALVLSTEMVGKRWREKVSTAGFFCFTLGFLSLPAMAYLNRGASWRRLYLWTSVPCFFYSVLIYFWIKESPRWLLVRGRRDEAIQTLKSMTANSRNAITSSFSKLIVAEDAGNIDNVFSAMKVLWVKRWALRRLLSAMTVGFGLGLVYYGMPLNGEPADLHGGVHHRKRGVQPPVRGGDGRAVADGGRGGFLLLRLHGLRPPAHLLHRAVPDVCEELSGHGGEAGDRAGQRVRADAGGGGEEEELPVVRRVRHGGRLLRAVHGVPAGDEREEHVRHHGRRRVQADDHEHLHDDSMNGLMEHPRTSLNHALYHTILCN